MGRFQRILSTHYICPRQGRFALRLRAYTPKISIDIDLSKSKIISLAIDRLHELVVGKPEKEGKPKQETSTKNETERSEEKG